MKKFIELLTDQEFDGESGLYNYDARMYDPVIGRFLSPDSIIPDIYNPQALNRYSYCYNNPLIYIDPTGHFAWDLYFYNPNLFGLLAGPMLMDEFMLDEIVVHGNRSDAVSEFFRRLNLGIGVNYSSGGSSGGSGGSSGGVQNGDQQGQGSGGVDLNLYPEDEGIYDAANRLPKKNGVFRIGAHGSAEYIKGPNGEKIYAKDLAAMLKKPDSGWKTGTTIHLLSCDTGKTPVGGGDSFAQQLADLLHVTVFAPNTKVFYDPSDWTVHFYDPDTNKTGKFIPFIPSD